MIGTLEIGGTERQLVEFLKRAPGDHHLALFEKRGPLLEEVTVPVSDIGFTGRGAARLVRLPLALARFRRLVREFEPHVVHAHLGLAEVVAAAATPKGTPLVASRRGRNVGFERNRLLKLVEGLAHRRVDLMICNSQYLAQWTREHDLWVPPVEVVYNGIDTERYRPLPLPSFDRPTITMIANFIPYKRHDLFVRAIAVARERLPDLKVLLVGEGPERARVEAMTAELDLKNQVVMVGSVPDVRGVIVDAHVVALTSEHEGFPNALLEAMAMGRPVVSTRVGGVEELVREGQDGFLVEPDPADIAGALTRLISDTGLIAEMGANATTRAESFSWTAVVHLMDGVYRSLRSEASAGSLGDGARGGT